MINYAKTYLPFLFKCFWSIKDSLDNETLVSQMLYHIPLGYVL